MGGEGPVLVRHSREAGDEVPACWLAIAAAPSARVPSCFSTCWQERLDRPPWLLAHCPRCPRRCQVYAAETRPFAVNYFTSGQNFNRALRLWANHAVPQLAQRYNPAAAGFKVIPRCREQLPRLLRRITKLISATHLRLLPLPASSHHWATVLQLSDKDLLPIRREHSHSSRGGCSSGVGSWPSLHGTAPFAISLHTWAAATLTSCPPKLPPLQATEASPMPGPGARRKAAGESRRSSTGGPAGLGPRRAVRRWAARASLGWMGLWSWAQQCRAQTRLTSSKPSASPLCPCPCAGSRTVEMGETGLLFIVHSLYRVSHCLAQDESNSSH